MARNRGGKRWKDRSAMSGSCAQSGITRLLSIYDQVLAFDLLLDLPPLTDLILQ